MALLTRELGHYNVIYIIVIHMKTQIILLIVILAWLGKCTPYFQSPLGLYVSDRNYSIIVERAVEKKEIVGILFTNKYCVDCYGAEEEMKKIIKDVWSYKKIKIMRSELSENSGLQEMFVIKRFPVLYYVLPLSSGPKIYHNNGILTHKSALKTAQRLSYYQSQLFYNSAISTEEKTLHLNMQELLFIEQQQIIQFYGLNSLFSNLPNIKFHNYQEMKEFLKIQGIKQLQHSSCYVYWKQRKQCFSPSSAEQLSFLLSLINYSKPIQFTQSTYKAYSELDLNLYVFIAVLDSIFFREKHQEYLQMLNQLLIQEKFRSKIVIFWMEAQINKKKLTQLGFKQTDIPPLFSMFQLSQAPKKILVNSKGIPIFNIKSIEQFMRNIISRQQKEEEKRNNKEFLMNSFMRLNIGSHFGLFDPNNKPSGRYFLLSLPFVSNHLLSNKHFFDPIIFNFQYQIQRVNRFINGETISGLFCFDPFICEGKESHGVYLIENRCHLLSKAIMFDQQQTSLIVQKIISLPQYYWINENQFGEYLQNHQNIQLKPFQYHQIDI